MADVVTHYGGPVCYQDGWHHAVVVDAGGVETVGDRLFLADDGTYRAAVDGDMSWHDRKHRAFAMVIPDGGAPGVSVSGDEMAAIQKLLGGMRGDG